MSSGERSTLGRREALALGAVGAAGALAGCSNDDTDGESAGADDSGEARAVTVGTAAAFPPFEQTDGDRITGHDVDLVEAVLEASEGYTLEGWRDERFADLATALVEEEIDVIAAALSITEDRSEAIAFAGQYFETRPAVLVAEDGPTPGSLEDLAGRTFGAQTGTTSEALIDTRLIDEEVISAGDYASYDTYPLAVAGLEDGVVDAVVVDAPVAWSFAERRAVRVAFDVDTTERYGFGVRTDEEDLAEALETGLQTVRNDGRYEEIAAEWLSGSERDESETDTDGNETTDDPNETASDNQRRLS
jgi:polar amino acid transport system substrate-binding protein